MSLIHFKSPGEMRGRDVALNRFAFSTCSGSFASRNRNLQQGIRHEGQAGVRGGGWGRMQCWKCSGAMGTEVIIAALRGS